MNQAMKLGTPNEMRGDSITAWHAGRQGVHFLEQMGADEFLNGTGFTKGADYYTMETEPGPIREKQSLMGHRQNS